MLGRPGTCDPVMKNVTPGAWFTASVYMLRTRQISSAISPTFGSISLISMPDLAVLLERFDRGEGRPLAVAARHGREPGRPPHAVGDVLPGRRTHHRLGVEQVHVRRPAPLPEDDDSLRLRGEMGQARQPGSPFGRSVPSPRAPFPRSDARAAIPTPLAAEPNNWRRVTRAIFSR